MSNAFHDQQDALHAAILALTPLHGTLNGGPVNGFIDTPGELHLEDDAPVMDRAVDVMIEDAGGESGPVWGTGPAGTAQRVERLLVGVRYDARADMNFTDSRMIEDADLIVSLAEAPASRATNVQLVSYAGRKVDRTRRQFPILWLSFDVTYLVAL